MSETLILLSAQAAAQIRDSGDWGRMACRFSEAENVGFVKAVGAKLAMLPPIQMSPKNHFLNSGDDREVGTWYRAKPELHLAWAGSRRRQAYLSLSGFASLINNGYRSPGNGAYLAITYAPGAAAQFDAVGAGDFAAWYVASEGVRPVDIDCEPEMLGAAQLNGLWPIETLSSATVMLVGAGSIGSATAHALCSYGVGRLLIIDPDRLQWHNLVRHTSGPDQVGRFKVRALRDELSRLRPETCIEAHALDVVTDADKIRPMIADADLVICTTDGVAPRRVVSHLARRGGRDAIVACVLDDGAIGEILRLRPWKDHGCLVCQRQNLTEQGAVDPEPAMDAGYGTGTRHRPMTAVGGDLHLVGQLAAKIGIATILERAGHPDHRLPGEYAILALRPQPGRAAPFDSTRAGDLRWLASSTPIAGCPTCEAP